MTTFWNIDEQPVDAVATRVTGDLVDKIQLTLRGDHASGHLLERRQIHAQGHLSVQRIPVNNRALVNLFVDADPSAPRLQFDYGALVAQANDFASPYSINFQDRVDQCNSEVELLNYIKQTCGAAGVDACMYHVILLARNERTVEIHDLLIADAGGWAQHYAQSAYFQSDPVFQRARRKVHTPFRLAEFIVSQPGHWFSELQEESGYGSNIMFSARMGLAIGVLHVGFASGREEMEAEILAKRSVLQGLTEDTIRRYTALRHRAWKTYLRLSPLEEQILEMYRLGHKADDIQERLELSRRQYEVACKVINQKMETDGIRESRTKMDAWKEYALYDF